MEKKKGRWYWGWGGGDPYHPCLSAPVLCSLEDTIRQSKCHKWQAHGSGCMRPLKGSNSQNPKYNGGLQKQGGGEMKGLSMGGVLICFSG